MSDIDDIKYLLGIIEELEMWLTLSPPIMTESRLRIKRITKRVGGATHTKGTLEAIEHTEYLRDIIMSAEDI